MTLVFLLDFFREGEKFNSPQVVLTDMTKVEIETMKSYSPQKFIPDGF